MITTEKLLIYISTAIVIITVLFSIAVVTREILKPEEPFKKIILSECQNKFVTVDENILSEHDLEKLADNCFLFPESLADKNPFAEQIFKNSFLFSYDYLFFGKAGVLLKKSSGMDYKSIANELLSCITGNSCSPESIGKKISFTVTLKLIDQGGELHASITFEDEVFSQIAKNATKLLNEMISVKEKSISDLRLIAIFHHSYGFIENKNSDYISSLLKRDIDGLYLKSRGAKIRLLPHEYNDNPVAVISRKGRQYGLDRDEIEKDEATVFTYRTTQFGQVNNNMTEWHGRYAALKSGYSDIIAARLIAKQLRNAINKDSLFDQEIEISSGKMFESKESSLLQFLAAGSLLNYGNLMNDEEILESVSKTIIRLILQTENPSILEKASFSILLRDCDSNCNTSNIKSSNFQLSKNEIEEYLSTNPVHTGILVESISKEKDLWISQLIEKSFEKFNQLNNEDKIRYLGYLFAVDFKNLAATTTVIDKIATAATPFIESVKFDNRGFTDFRGGFSAEERLYPGVLLSALLANGLANLVSSGNNNQSIVHTEAEAGNFLRFMIVTDHDYSYWETATAKPRVQGGLRAHPRGSRVRTVNSSAALSYFVNRIEAKRNR